MFLNAVLDQARQDLKRAKNPWKAAAGPEHCLQWLSAWWVLAAVASRLNLAAQASLPPRLEAMHLGGMVAARRLSIASQGSGPTIACGLAS